MVEEDKGNGAPDDHAVDAVVGALQQAQVADEQGNLEEADADLIDGAAGKVDASIRDEILLRAQLRGQAQAVFGLDDAKDRISNGKDERQDGHQVITSESVILSADVETGADNDGGERGHDDGDGDDRLVLRNRVDSGAGVGDVYHDGGGFVYLDEQYKS